MKTLTYIFLLSGLISIVPAHAARTTRPVVVVTTTSTATPPVSLP